MDLGGGDFFVDFEPRVGCAICDAGFIHKVRQIEGSVVVAHIIEINQDRLLLNLPQIPHKNIQIVQIIMTKFYLLRGLPEIGMDPRFHRHKIRQ